LPYDLAQTYGAIVVGMLRVWGFTVPPPPVLPSVPVVRAKRLARFFGGAGAAPGD
jgi:hypothetical protein